MHSKIISAVAMVIGAAFVAGQTTPLLPECVLGCAYTPLGESGCGLNPLDAVCICEKVDALMGMAMPCLQSHCANDPTAIQTAKTQIAQYCAAVSSSVAMAPPTASLAGTISSATGLSTAANLTLTISLVTDNSTAVTSTGNSTLATASATPTATGEATTTGLVAATNTASGDASGPAETKVSKGVRVAELCYSMLGLAVIVAFLL